jgi:hypothetical protein
MPNLVPGLKLGLLPNFLVAYPRDFAFHVTHPIRSIETLSLPTLHHRDPCGFAFYVTHPIRSIQSSRDI